MGVKMSFPVDSPQEFITWAIVVFCISIIFYFICYFGFGIISFLASIENGIVIMIIAILIIVGIIAYLWGYDKRKLKKYLKEKSIDDEYLMNKILKSNDKNPKIVTIYGLPKHLYKNYKWRYKNEEIIEFLYNLNNKEKWGKNELDEFIDNIPDDYGSASSYYCYNPPKQVIHKILVKDNYICQKCGKNLLDLIENENKTYLIEKKDYIQFINPPKPHSVRGALAEDNLITVCEDCKKNRKVEKSKSTTISSTSHKETTIIPKNKEKSQNKIKYSNQNNIEKNNDFQPVDNLFSKTNESNENPVKKIKDAKELLDMGAITQEEFDKIKSKYLDEI